MGDSDGGEEWGGAGGGGREREWKERVGRGREGEERKRGKWRGLLLLATNGVCSYLLPLAMNFLPVAR
ncbi:conserved hypothetical protein [Ricinus communis]|uniref:Uncharacterized protein n=1 Tax=Ricinus communis TaxID=3988 RepID=B9REN4_RICCO|nr:conserved hypothetical protein [Ricinus communis]